MRRILSGHSRNKGVTLITLIIVIMMFGVFVTVFAYIMSAKHGTEPLYVHSTQAYAVAQAGIEYGIRYSTDLYIADPDNYDVSEYPIENKSLGNGKFTLSYIGPHTDPNPNLSHSSRLESIGKVGVAERKIILKNFLGYVTGGGIIKDPHEDSYTS